MQQPPKMQVYRKLAEELATQLTKSGEGLEHKQMQVSLKERAAALDHCWKLLDKSLGPFAVGSESFRVRRCHWSVSSTIVPTNCVELSHADEPFALLCFHKHALSCLLHPVVVWGCCALPQGVCGRDAVVIYNDTLVNLNVTASYKLPLFAFKCCGHYTAPDKALIKLDSQPAETETAADDAPGFVYVDRPCHMLIKPEKRRFFVLPKGVKVNIQGHTEAGLFGEREAFTPFTATTGHMYSIHLIAQQ